MLLYTVCRITILSKIEKEVHAVFECSNVLSVFSHFTRVCLFVFSYPHKKDTYIYIYIKQRET